MSISNLNTKTINIKIQTSPKSKFYQINDQNNDIIKIGGDHSKKIIITFQPLQIRNYSDEILLSIISNTINDDQHHK